MRKIVIAGTGYPEIISICEQGVTPFGPVQVIGFLDDNLEHASRDLKGYSILGGFEWLKDNNPQVLVVNSIARDCMLRVETTNILRSYGAKFVSVAHRSASVDFAKVREGSVFGKNTIVEANATIGSHSFLMNGSVISHDTNVGEFAIVSNNCSIQGHNKIGDRVYFGAMASTSPNVTIKSDSIIGNNCNISASIEYSFLCKSPSPIYFQRRAT